MNRKDLLMQCELQSGVKKKISGNSCPEENKAGENRAEGNNGRKQ